MCVVFDVRGKCCIYTGGALYTHAVAHVFWFVPHFREFIGMTCHWIDPKELVDRRVVLTCRPMAERHTKDNLAKAIMAIHKEFGLEGKISMTTTDNASNFVASFK